MTLTTLLVPSAYVDYNYCVFYVMQISLDQQKSSWNNKHDVKIAWKQTDGNLKCPEAIRKFLKESYCLLGLLEESCFISKCVRTMRFSFLTNIHWMVV